MKNLLSALFLFSFISNSIAKENSFFVGTKLSNGRFVYVDRYDEPIGGEKKFKNTRYYLGNYYLFGITVKNVSISSGIGYNFFHKKSPFYEPIVPWPITKSFNTHLISIPVNIDYNINIYKNKLFVIIGGGFEYSVFISNKIKYVNENSISQKYKDVNKYANAHSLIITTRCGLLYSINKTIDIFSTFDFGFYATKYLRNREYSQPGQNYILSNSIGINIKFGKNIKKDKKDKEETTKITSYKTQQPFLLN